LPYPAGHDRNGIDETRGYGNETNSIDPTPDRDIQSCVQPERPPKIGEKSMAPQYVSVATVPATLANDASKSIVTRILTFASSLDRVGMGVLRLGLVVVLLWIGGLKFAAYEADSIVPLVANSPLISFVYHHPEPEYRHYLNKEGELKPANRTWHRSNGTYPVSYGLGAIIVSLGILIALYPVRPELSAIGSFLLIFMALTTLSFLITTPEVWVPALGDSNHGFPYLSGVGRLIIKDSIMLGAAFLTMTDAARESLRRRSRRG
jgi:reactive chlorine resistance protein C